MKRLFAVMIALILCLAAPVAQAAATATAQAAVFAASDSVEPGGSLTLYVIYRFDAAAAVQRVTVDLPAGVQVTSAPAGASVDGGGRLSWDVPGSAAAAQGIATVELQVDSGAQVGSQLQAQAHLLAGLTGSLSVVADSAVESVGVGPQEHQPFFQGYPDGSFGPARSITRAEVAAVAPRIAGLSDPAPATPTFADTGADHWAYRHVEAATKSGYMQGYPDGRFRPDQAITRAEFVAVLLRLRTVPAVLPGGSTPFSDVAPEYWGAAVLITANAIGVVAGYPDGLFQPDASIRRDEAAAVLARALGHGPLADGQVRVMQHFPDVSPDNWAFGWVEETSKVAHTGVHGADGAEHLAAYVDTRIDW